MPKLHILQALLAAFLIAGGQLLFKAGANELQYTNLSGFLLATATNLKIVLAIALYAATILLWVNVLAHLPLTVAYPIMGAAYIIVPLLGYLVFKEEAGVYTVVGCTLIFLGICLASLQAGSH